MKSSNDFGFSDEDREDMQRMAKEVSETMSSAGGPMIEGAFKMKIFGLPMWAWMLIGVGTGLSILAGLIWLIAALFA